MSADSTVKPEKFGAVLGLAPGNVPIYSSDYDSADEKELPDRHAYRNYIDGIYMGYKWQCVEFARRWLYLNKGYIFDNVAMAFDIFELDSVREVRTNRRLPLRSFRNGARTHPQPGCLLIWEEGGEFEDTGHVAIVTEVTPQWVRFVEQNVGHARWPEGQNFSRQINARVTDSGEFWLQCSFGDAEILGWVIQTDDALDAEPARHLDRRLFNLVLREVEDQGQAQRSWLNMANPDEAAYVDFMHGHKLSADADDQFKYLCVSNTAHEELRDATTELHALFLHATDFVLRDDKLLSKFNIPRALWPKIHQSWNNRRNQMITGRFDFSVTERGLKVYEYNCDSASCHLEAGKIQGKWAQHFGCAVGRDAGAPLHGDLKDAWEESRVDGVLHIMQDRDQEETYHALFMREALQAAGIESKIIHGVHGLSWDADGNILDPDGLPIRWVWKTWAWETALDQIRLECEDDEHKLENYRPGVRHDGPPRLVDVLLRNEVMVFEPLWTLIPSNKAILPVLWQLSPNHPHLLNSSFELTDELRRSGYVAKPIVGRCGSNITIIDANATTLEETAGQFEKQANIYQELCALPLVDGRYMQVCTFSAEGAYAGSCVRLERSMIVNQNSDLIAMRVVDDEEILEVS